MGRFLGKMSRHRKRLEGLSFSQKSYYIAQALFGEILRRRTPFFGPRLIEISLTHRCQCRCVHCYDAQRQDEMKHSELGLEEVVDILKQARELGCSEVCFTGGEPLVRDDLVALVARARSLGLMPKMNSNGIGLTPEAVKALKQAGLGWCSVSIDSADAEKHDDLRKYPGCFARATEGLRELRRQGIASSITTYARKEAVRGPELGRIIELGHELGVETVRILFPVPLGEFMDSPEQILTDEERNLVRRHLIDPIVTMESPRETTSCTAAITKFNVQPDGSVTPCVFIPMAYGNLRQESLRSIWQKMDEFNKLYKPTGHCPMCDKKFRARLFSEAND